MEDGIALIDIAILFALILLNGFFSMSEMALVSARKTRLQSGAQEGKRSYQRALQAAQEPSRFLSTIQVGISLIGTFAGAFGGATVADALSSTLARIPAMAPYADAVSIFVVVLAITFFSIVLGELVPKQIALTRPEAIAGFTVPVLDVLSRIFRPVVGLLSRTTALVLKLLGADKSADPAITEDEIRVILDEGEKVGVVERDERTMVEGIFYLGDRPVETFMRHRSELTWLDLNADADEARRALRQRADIRSFPVCKEGPDDIVGVVSARELLDALLDGDYRGLKPLIRKPAYAPGTMPALRAFQVFKREKADTLLILDEYGGLEGALTLEDLVSEIIGELSVKEADAEEIVKREDGSYLMGGLVNADDFFELFHLERSVGEHREYHTLAGFLLDTLGSIPRTGERLEWKGFRFEIVDMDGNRIDKVLVTPPGAIVDPSI